MQYFAKTLILYPSIEGLQFFQSRLEMESYLYGDSELGIYDLNALLPEENSLNCRMQILENCCGEARVSFPEHSVSTCCKYFFMVE